MLRAYVGLIHTFGVIAALAIGAMAVLVTFDVVARNVGLGTSPWIVDVSEISLSVVTFLAVPWLLYKNEHVRLDVLLVSLSPRTARKIETIANLIGMAICVVFLFYSAKTLFVSASQNQMSVKSIVIPEWWLYIPVPICFALLSIEFLRRLVNAPVAGSPEVVQG